MSDTCRPRPACSFVLLSTFGARPPRSSTRRAETPDLNFKRLELVLRLAHVGLKKENAPSC